MNPNSPEYRKKAQHHLEQLKANYTEAFATLDSEQSKRETTPRKNSRQPLTSSNASLSVQQLLHLLRRTRFGVRKDEYEYFKDKSKEEIIDELFTDNGIDLPLNYYSPHIEDEDTDVALGETFVNADYLTDEVESGRIISIKQWIMFDALKSSRSIAPAMWIFWQNHFATEHFSVFYAWASYRHFKMLRDLSLGNFKEMVEKITIDSIMLLYLNGASNRKDSPDENYARELQELFTLGKGEGSQYTEQDVAMAARVLTGWTIDEYGEEPKFYPEYHDTGDKQFSAFYDNTVIQGKSGDDGQSEYLDLINMIFAKNEVSKFICRRLYRYFVYAHIDTWTEENIIEPMAQIFRDNDYEIKPVLRALLQSDHFFDEVNYGAIIKSPIEFMVNFVSATGLPLYKEDPSQNYLYGASLFWRIATLGQQLADPPSVAGWPAYYQSPVFDKYWITTTTITQRISVSDSVVWWGLWTEYGKEEWDYIAFTKSLYHPEDPNALINEVALHFSGYPLRSDLQAQLKNILLTGQQSDHYWTDSWQEFLQDESDEEKKTIIVNRLRPFFQKFFQSPETQLK